MPGNSVPGSFICRKESELLKRQRRHVAERVGEEHGVERAEAGLIRGEEQDAAADDMQRAEESAVWRR
jgi:hypothetical protein